jgi:hypothetical protein
MASSGDVLVMWKRAYDADINCEKTPRRGQSPGSGICKAARLR